MAGALSPESAFESVEPDLRMHPQAVPNDTYYQQQWHYYEAAGGIDAPPAWDTTTGAAGIKVAVIDTGVLPHADLASRLVGGYDFVQRIAGGTDPGDYGCNGSTSSWHGTHVAGTIGALTNNGNGVAGINWVSQIVPVRVLGRCGGYTSDIVDGMRWAAGIDVPGVQSNPNPVRIENLSLGGDGACSSTFQSAINDVIAKGTVVVVAAGNSNVDATNAQPASCSGVIAVGATGRNGGRASYSNYGSTVAISAPGGSGNDGVLSTLNTGTTTPAADTYAYYQGTSMATPHVVGTISLMLAVNSALTPAQVLQALQQSARAFPTGTGADCTIALCGAGIVDAARAVAAVGSSAATTWTTIANEGQSFTVTGTQTVRYGNGSSFITKSVTGSGTCSNAFFGSDPLYGTAKVCQVQGTSSAWTTIANEGQAFSVSGTQTVRYGAGSSFITQSVTGSGSCTNTYFGGDPIYGTAKVCQVSTAVATTNWTKVATEGQSFSVSGTQTVRYGSGSTFVTMSVTSGGACTNAYFGTDPTPNVVKECDVAN